MIKLFAKLVSITPNTGDRHVAALLALLKDADPSEKEAIYQALDTIPCWVNPDHA